MRPRTNAQLLRRAATPRLLLSARRRPLCTPPAGAGNATFAAWAPRVALAAVPISVGAGLYVWRNWDNGSDARSRATAWTTGEIPRSQFESRYRLKKSLGKGGFGEVWLALDVSSGKEVAIKVLSMKQLPRSMVEQEITAMQRCGRHPNVVSLLDAFWIAPDKTNPHGEAALVMEVAAGGGLFERLVEDGAYSEEYAAKILQQIAVALYHLRTCRSPPPCTQEHNLHCAAGHLASFMLAPHTHIRQACLLLRLPSLPLPPLRASLGLVSPLPLRTGARRGTLAKHSPLPRLARHPPPRHQT